MPKTSPSLLFSPQVLAEVSWAERNWPKVTQPTLLLKTELKLTVSQFLTWSLNHLSIKLNSICIKRKTKRNNENQKIAAEVSKYDKYVSIQYNQ